MRSAKDIIADDHGPTMADILIKRLDAGGYAIVPKEPTPEMIGDDMTHFDHHRKDDSAAIYREMVRRFWREPDQEK